MLAAAVSAGGVQRVAETFSPYTTAATTTTTELKEERVSRRFNEENLNPRRQAQESIDTCAIA